MPFIDIHTHQQNLLERDIPSVGIHPNTIAQIKNLSEELSKLRIQASDKNILAIGEAGLDKRVSTSLDLQQKVFEAHIQLSEDLQKPLIIHNVKHWDLLFSIKKEYNPAQPWIIHGFRGNPIQAKQLLDKDFYLSFGYYFHSESPQEAWPHKIFAETDESICGIEEIYKKLANNLNVSLAVLEQELESNVNKVFSISSKK